MTTWTHSALVADVLNQDAANGLVRAKRTGSGWTQGSMVQRVNDLRAYLALSAWTAARLAGRAAITGPPGEGGLAEADPRPLPSAKAERARAASALLRTQQLLAARLVVEGDLQPLTTDLRTEHKAEETQLVPLAAAAIAVGALGVAAAYAYVAHQAAQVIDRQLQRREKTARLIETDARLVELTHDHVSREQQAGRQLPLDEATKEAMRILEARQKQLLKDEPELKSGLEKLGGSIPFKVGAGIGLGLVALVIAGVWYLTN